MLKIKTAELTGAALDWAAAKCEEHTINLLDVKGQRFMRLHKYSTEWAQGGPIIEREKLGLTYSDSVPCWYATSQKGKRFLRLGDTPLIAAMRCYVASKLGDTIEIPTELI